MKNQVQTNELAEMFENDSSKNKIQQLHIDKNLCIMFSLVTLLLKVLYL